MFTKELDFFFNEIQMQQKPNVIRKVLKSYFLPSERSSRSRSES